MNMIVVVRRSSCACFVFCIHLQMDSRCLPCSILPRPRLQRHSNTNYWRRCCHPTCVLETAGLPTRALLWL